jgi:hypothetical protein
MKQKSPLEERNWQALSRHLPEGWRELAVTEGVIKPVPPQLGAKLNDIEPLLRLVLSHVTMNWSLRVATSMAAAAQLVTVSPVALHLRMKKVGGYLRALLSRMVSSHVQFSPARWGGYEVILTDATVARGPGTHGATARVHYAMRLEDVNLVQVEVTGDDEGETFRHFRAKAGQLWVGDRGYANPPGVQWIVGQQADVLVRINRSSLPLFDVEDRRLDLRPLVQKQPGRGRIFEQLAFVRPQDSAPIRGRWIWLRLPKEQAQKARARVRREQGPSVSADELDWAEYVLLWTTAPQGRLSQEQVMDVYRARWRMELSIKRDKSITALDGVPNIRTDTVESWIVAKLLAQQLALRVAAPAGAFSP